LTTSAGSFYGGRTTLWLKKRLLADGRPLSLLSCGAQTTRAGGGCWRLGAGGMAAGAAAAALAAGRQGRRRRAALPALLPLRSACAARAAAPSCNHATYLTMARTLSNPVSPFCGGVERLQHTCCTAAKDGKTRERCTAKAKRADSGVSHRPSVPKR